MKRIILTITTVLTFNLFGRAEIINFKDGSKIDGVITSEQSGIIQVKTKYGVLSINKSDILLPTNDEKSNPTTTPNEHAIDSGRELGPMITVKTQSLARGEKFSFQLNGKYIGNVLLDKDFNITSQESEPPASTIKVYSKEGKLQKEFVFGETSIKTLSVYDSDGQLKAKYGYFKNKAIPLSEPTAATTAQSSSSVEEKMVAKPVVTSVTTEYDKFKDATVIKIPTPPGLTSKPLLRALSVYPGKNLISHPPSVAMGFVSTTEEWEYLECHSVDILADGNRIAISEPEHDGRVGSGYVLEFIDFDIQWPDLNKLSTAKTVEVKICNTVFMLSQGNMTDLKEFVRLLTLQPAQPVNTIGKQTGNQDKAS